MGWRLDDLPANLRRQAEEALHADRAQPSGPRVLPSPTGPVRRADGHTGGNGRNLTVVTERDWQATVVDYATTRGWRHYHTHDSRRSPAGFPDLILVRPPRLVAVELKAQQGKLTTAQVEWLALLHACPQVETHVWRPSDWPAVQDVFR